MPTPSQSRVPVFIVGTGRCGSTMLSNFLREHPRILSISEFFTLISDLGGRIAETFPEGPIESVRFWQVIASPHPKQTMMLRHGVTMDEVLYQPGPDTRFSMDSGVPAIMQTTLPHLTTNADAFFDEVHRFVLSQPTAPAGTHYLRLFAWLTERFGKAVWVERSGGSLRLVRRLATAFPGARFVHLVRDGRDTAVSMSRHYGFRMALLSMQLTEVLGVDPFESSDRTWTGDLSDDLMPFLPESFSGAAFRSYQTPLPLCGHYWSGEIMQGLRELAMLPSDRVITLRYEDFLTSPVPTGVRLLSFIDPAATHADHESHGERLSRVIRPAQSAWTALPPSQRAELERACQPGFAALGAIYEAVQR